MKRMGRLIIRCALLAKKEGKGRESKQYGSLDESSKAYIGELIAMDKDAGEKAAKTAGVDLASLDVPELAPSASHADVPNAGEDPMRVLSLHEMGMPCCV